VTAIAGAFVVGIMAVLFMALPHATYIWAPVVGACPVTAAVVLAIASALSVTAGAFVVRRRWRPSNSTAAVVAFGAVVVLGILTTCFDLVQGLGAGKQTGVQLAAVVAALFVGGYVTQRSIAVPRPWACSVGGCIFGVLNTIDQLIRGVRLNSEFWYGLVGFGLMTLIARWGAGVAAKRLAPPDVEVPEARLNRQ
jgi:hypothetical protein